MKRMELLRNNVKKILPDIRDLDRQINRIVSEHCPIPT